MLEFVVVVGTCLAIAAVARWLIQGISVPSEIPSTQSKESSGPKVATKVPINQKIILEQYGPHRLLRIGEKVYEHLCQADEKGKVYHGGLTSRAKGAKEPDMTRPLGSTSWTDKQIEDFCQAYQGKHETYNFSNCANFVDML